MKVYQTKLEEADYKAINKWHPSLNGKLEMAYLIYGEAMNLIVGRVEPGTEFSDDPNDPNKPCIFVEVAATPKLKEHLKEFKVIAKREE